MSAKVRYVAYVTLVNQQPRAATTEYDELLAALPQRSWLAQVRQRMAGWLPGVTKGSDADLAANPTGTEAALSSHQL